MRLLYFTITLAVVLISSNGYSQSGNHQGFVNGEVLVQLKNNGDLDAFLNDYMTIDLKTKQIVSARFNIYLIEFDDTKATNASALRIIKSNKFIVNAQNNHYVTDRKLNELIPDDQYFDDQWSFKNTGQSGGLLNADIDATDAWGITTGGITAEGDTIVIVIVDSGSDLDHDDINFWKNNAEIPDNGIDDDDNGYIDDYDGWNALSHNDNITSGNHGTHVAGIAAAIGNNGIGVAGVNWGAKVLPVIGSSAVESIVVEALSYVYVIRETYDLTNGDQGAFIVANNNSFGVDQGQPEDYPIWEAMYDSLGKLGILSMGATANRNWDIDQVGDIPCSFATDFLISITNTTRFDELYTSAAWGDTTIDLAAPGTQIKSLYTNNSIGIKTGTSMAAPHVTGSVALLFAAADADFIDNYKTNPTVGALLMKRYILNGVDTLDDLKGKTVSGGRLNVFNSMNKLINAQVVVDKDFIFNEMLLNTNLNDLLTLSNNDSDSLKYSISLKNDPEWLSIDHYAGIIAGGESNELILYFDNSGLDTGYYETILTIDDINYFGKNITIGMQVYDDLSVESIISTIKVDVFPNPFAYKISFQIDGIGATKLEVFDQYGKLVYQKEIEVSTKGKLINVNTNNFAIGFYYYRIKTDMGTVNGKIIKTSSR